MGKDSGTWQRRGHKPGLSSIIPAGRVSLATSNLWSCSQLCRGIYANKSISLLRKEKVFCYLVEDFGKGIFFFPLFSHPICVWLMVQVEYSSSEHCRKQNLGFQGKLGYAWAVLKGKRQVHKVDHLRGFSVFICVASRRKPLMAEASRAAVA